MFELSGINDHQNRLDKYEKYHLLVAWILHTCLVSEGIWMVDNHLIKNAATTKKHQLLPFLPVSSLSITNVTERSSQEMEENPYPVITMIVFDGIQRASQNSLS